jgi:hypothetical protein
MESRQPPPINGGLNQQYPPEAVIRARSAAEHHGKGDHAKGKEHAESAKQRSQTAHQHSDQATPRASSENSEVGESPTSAGPFCLTIYI